VSNLSITHMTDVRETFGQPSGVGRYAESTPQDELQRRKQSACSVIS